MQTPDQLWDPVPLNQRLTRALRNPERLQQNVHALSEGEFHAQAHVVALLGVGKSH